MCNWYLVFCYSSLFWNITITRPQITLTSLNECIILIYSIPLHVHHLFHGCKIFIIPVRELAYSHTNFKLAWKMARWSASLSSASCCHFFWHLVVSKFMGVIFHLSFISNLTVTLIFVQSFTWRLTYAILSLLGRCQMDLTCPLFLGKNKQHMPVHAQMISSWVREGLDIAKAHVSGYSQRCGSVGNLCG